MMNDLEDTSEALPEDKQNDKNLADNKAKLNTSMFEPILSSKLSPGGQIVGAFGVQSVLINAMFEPCRVQFLALFGVQRRFENKNAKGNSWGR